MERETITKKEDPRINSEKLEKYYVRPYVVQSII